MVIEELARFEHLESFGIHLSSHGSLELSPLNNEFMFEELSYFARVCMAYVSFAGVSMAIIGTRIRIQLQGHQWHFSTNAREISAGRYY
ncbi:hypothetical protein C8J56DRAFT_1161705 [Mycena floridula]|nr:hypothetical protein C8J56DRAFT_1161705 [Mycena floridula]